jgi:ABC-type protease/lipase transport system fused ATPase/permease subunit
MIMGNGLIQTFGPRAEVLAAFQKAHEERVQAAAAAEAAKSAAVLPIEQGSA